MMHNKHIVNSSQLHYGWDNRLAPVFHVKPGELVEFDTIDAGPVSRHFDAKGYEVTMAMGPDLMESAKNAV